MIDPEQISARPLIADGAMEPALRRVRPDTPEPIEALNLSDPESVRAAHAAYVVAGARLIRTNTAGAGAPVLARFGLEARVEAINNSGVASARAAQGPEGLLMGTLGMIDSAMATPLERERAYGEQAVYLSDTGVVFFMLHHFNCLDEALRAVKAVSRVSDAPVLAQLVLGASGCTAEGVALDEAARRLVAAGAGALGLECAPAPAVLTPLVETLLNFQVPVSVMPGLRTPGFPGPHALAPALTPEDFAAVMAPLAALGVAILGGCCGVTPEHIAALAQACQRP